MAPTDRTLEQTPNRPPARISDSTLQTEDASPLTSTKVAHQIRRTVLEYVVKTRGGYLSQACSSAELLATLYVDLLNLGPSLSLEPPPPFAGVPGPGFRGGDGSIYHGAKGPELDRLLFSPAHYALVLYSALIATGRLHPDALDQFNVDGSTMEMIGAEHSPGFETTSGTLAQTLSVAGGIALGRRMKGESGLTYVFMSDGEFQEGQTWEAIAALTWHKLDTVIAVVDVNGQQCDGPMDTVMNVEPLAERVRSFGATCHDIDGHDIQALKAAAKDRVPGKATIILGRTDPTRGMPLLAQRAPMLHSVKFKSDDEVAAYRRFYEENYQ